MQLGFHHIPADTVDIVRIPLAVVGLAVAAAAAAAVEPAVPSFAEQLLDVVGLAALAEPVSSCRSISAGASAEPWQDMST